jgi:hypothetical protein
MIPRIIHILSMLGMKSRHNLDRNGRKSKKNYIIQKKSIMLHTMRDIRWPVSGTSESAGRPSLHKTTDMNE